MDNRREKDYDRAMSTQPRTPTPRMTVEEFLAWPRAGRGGTNSFAARSSRRRRSGPRIGRSSSRRMCVAGGHQGEGASLSCRPDGATVRIDDTTAYEPDAMVFCGPKPPPSALLVENPVIIVEVLSPIDGAERSGAQAGGLFPPAERRALSDHRSR